MAGMSPESACTLQNVSLAVPYAVNAPGGWYRGVRFYARALTACSMRSIPFSMFFMDMA